MLCVLPIMAAEWHLRGLDPQKVRVWLAMMSGSIAAVIAGELAPTGTHQLGAYVAIDIIVAGLILRHPRGLAQKTIGGLSGVMVLFGTGYLVSVLMGGNNPLLYGQVMVALSWLRFGILASWGAGDVVGMALHRHRVSGPALDYRADAG